MVRLSSCSSMHISKIRGVLPPEIPVRECIEMAALASLRGRGTSPRYSVAQARPLFLTA
jgi:predicted ATPase with chaperone activity